MTPRTTPLRRAPRGPLPLHDLHPVPESFRDAVLRGLSCSQKSLEPKWFYDRRGSELFERITRLPEYYPTRTELGILRSAARQLALLLGPRVSLVEYGSGSSAKVRLLLDALRTPTAYVPIDISREFLLAAAAELAAEYPDLRVLPVCADWSRPLALPPAASEGATRRVVFFPGSSIGNLHPDEAARFLCGAARLAGAGGGLLVGVDTPPEPPAPATPLAPAAGALPAKTCAVVEAAYDDPAGVTAAFDTNLLVRINRELGGTFDVARFQHRALWNGALGRVEMHLESLADQTVRVAGEVFRFARGETIHTECSYKYAPDDFAALASRCGFTPERVWTDPAGWFAVHWLRVADGQPPA